MVRSPPKLHALLHQHDVTVPTANLAVIQGSIDDAAAVRRTLIVASSSAPDTPNPSPDGDADGELVDFIVSGVGGTPRFDNPLRPTLDNPTICQDAVRAVLDACRALQSQGLAAGSGFDSTGAPGGDHTAMTQSQKEEKKKKKPYLVVVSTTGIASKRDIPIAMIPLYHWMLKVPHEDKRVMEEIIRGEMRREKEGERALSGYTIIRPSLLMSCEGVGAGKIRFGVDDDAAVGDTISRTDVGAWMFERLVEGKGEFEGSVVSLTA